MAWVANHVVEFDRLPFDWNLEAIGDFQLGSQACDKRLIKAHLKRISKGAGGIVSLGDLEDEDRPSTRQIRARIAAERSEVRKRDSDKHQIWLDHDAIPTLRPLITGDKTFIGGLAGHHWTQLDSTTNSVEYIYRALSHEAGYRIGYWGVMSSWIYIRFRGVGKFKGKFYTALGHIQHGVGGGQTLASALNKLERTAQGFPADFYIRAHDCKLVAAKTVEVYPVNAIPKPGKLPVLRHKDIVLLNIGSATRGYNISKEEPEYVESAMMRPTAMGWGTIRFHLCRQSRLEDQNQSIKCDLRVTL